MQDFYEQRQITPTPAHPILRKKFIFFWGGGGERNSLLFFLFFSLTEKKNKKLVYLLPDRSLSYLIYFYWSPAGIVDKAF